MFDDKPKRKEKPKNGQSKRIRLILVACIAVVAGGLVPLLMSKPQVDPPPMPKSSVLSLNLPASEPHIPENLSMAVVEDEADLAWNKPTYASSYYEDGYPSRATNGIDGQPGSDMWRSAGSTGSWFYVDLGKPTTFSRITSTLFVDSNFSKAPATSYIISDDLQTWRVVYYEINGLNAANRWIPRELNLSRPVTARYVGLYAENWGGGWADLSRFNVWP